MRTQTAVLRRSLPKLAAFLLGSALLVFVWEDVRGDTEAKPQDTDSGDSANAAQKAGKHLGETRQLEVEITFWGEFGQTVTDENGTHYYRYSGGTSHEDKVYPPEYWGTFPLYYFGMSNGVTVTIRNNGPRRKAKLCIRTEAYVLRTDGSSGHALIAPREIEVEVARGETETIDASFIIFYTPQSESGMDLFFVKVSHANEGGGPGNSEPALIAVKQGVFCPPEDSEEEAF